MSGGNLITAREAAALVGRPIGTIRGWADSGHLPVAKSLVPPQGGGPWRLFDPSEVQAVAEVMVKFQKMRKRVGPEPTADEVEAEKAAILAERLTPPDLGEGEREVESLLSAADLAELGRRRSKSAK